MKTGEPKSVVRHTRTITTYYMSDELSEEQLKEKLEGFLSELQLPDSYEADGVMAVTSSCDAEEVDEVQTFAQLRHRNACLHVKREGDKLVLPPDFKYSLEDELKSWDIFTYDLTMESWQQHKQARLWLGVDVVKGNNG